MGGSLGIAGLQALLIQESATAHERLAAGIVPSDPLIRWSLPGSFSGSGALEALNAEVTRQGTMMAYDTLFAWMALVSLLIAPLLLILRPARKAKSESVIESNEVVET
jgi:DHA2 family multidrug resistance protein